MHKENYLQYLYHDPLLIFLNSKTPTGLYARQRWLEQGDAESWKVDFNQTVYELFLGQKMNGSWEDSPLLTIRRLFGLHLTVRNRNKQIEEAIEWLFSQYIFSKEKEPLVRRSAFVPASDLQNLPFSRGCYDHFMTCAILFLASLFGYAYDERVLRTYDKLENNGKGKKEKWCNWSCSNNFLRACIVHPEYKDCERVRFFVSALQKVQKNGGLWPAPIPFYQTVNALGHLDTEQSDDILIRAFRKLRENQNKEGTWGRTDKEWKTFLIVHAIKRKGLLLQKMQGTA